jgi:hypothetical protein
MKKLIAAMATAGLLVAGTAGIAEAAATTDTKAPVERADRTARRHGVLKVAAQAIGIERKALVTALRDGQSLAEVAEANDVEPEVVVDAIVKARNKRIDAALDAGRITEDRAATMRSRAPERVTKLVNGEHNGRRRAERVKARRQSRRVGFAVAADAIGIPPKELRAEVRDGTSIADVARANDVDPQEVINAIVAAANAKIDAAVDAEKIDAQRAETIKGRLAERIAARVETGPRRLSPGS